MTNQDSKSKEASLKKERLKLSKSFCMVPWIHIHLSTEGEIFSCIDSTSECGPFANIKSTTLKEAWNDPYYRQLRLSMLKEEMPSQCAKCHKIESYGRKSRRMEFNEDFSQHYDVVETTAFDGKVEDMKIRYMDFRWSNVCNLRCRMCMPLNSTSLYEDFKKLYGPQPHQKTLLLEEYNSTIKEEILDQLPFTDVIYFAGGEPLLMDQHYEVLDRILAINRQDEIHLVYNTNMTHLSYKGQNVLDKWQKFSKVTVFGSIDAVGERGNYLRKGSNWEVIKSHRLLMKEQCPHVNFFVTPTVNIMNALHLPDLFWTCLKEGLIEPENFRIYFLLDPYFFSAQLLPPELKNELKNSYEILIKKLQLMIGPGETLNGFMSVKNFVLMEDKSHLLPDFKEYIKKFDVIQKTDFKQTFPELNGLL